MLAIVVLLIILMSFIVGFKAGQLWYTDAYEVPNQNHPSVTVEEPAHMNGDTIYFAYIRNQEREFWKDKG